MHAQPPSSPNTQGRVGVAMFITHGTPWCSTGHSLESAVHICDSLQSGRKWPPDGGAGSFRARGPPSLGL